MRWDSLFDDLEAQFFSERALQRESEISERARVELAGLSVGDRLRGVGDAEFGVVLAVGLRLRGPVIHVGRDFLVILEGGFRQWLIPYASVTYYEGLGRVARAPRSPMEGSLTLASASRGLARDRAEVSVHVAGAGADAQSLLGVIDRVGRDHLDLAITRGEARRAGKVAAVATIPFTSLAAICSSRAGL
ncbi:hypothetical protein AB0N65_04415 [Paenarthrobacter sp. NPDC089322]|uniref:hypothetical protein n=1 Tax=Paenarthrobacter sp. NPDC089322 TaxID=3155065 RepID=UPI00342AB245